MIPFFSHWNTSDLPSSVINYREKKSKNIKKCKTRIMFSKKDLSEICQYINSPIFFTLSSTKNSKTRAIIDKIIRNLVSFISIMWVAMTGQIKKKINLIIKRLKTWIIKNEFCLSNCNKMAFYVFSSNSYNSSYIVKNSVHFLKMDPNSYSRNFEIASATRYTFALHAFKYFWQQEPDVHFFTRYTNGCTPRW